MRKLVCIAMLFSLALSMFAFLDGVDAGTSVNGLIKSNTTWRLSGSPYQFTGPVGIVSGVTLTIEPGVTVDFGEYYLQVNGTLQAQGTKDNMILFKASVSTQNYLQQIQFMGSSTSWDNQTAKGCILRNSVFESATISAQDGCSPAIANNIFYNQIWIIISARTASVAVINNVFQDVYYECLSVGKSSIVTNNLFNRTIRQATAVVAHDNSYVGNNEILGFYNGITIDGRSTVKDNVILNCSNTGIWSLNENADIICNYIANNKDGINGGGNIESNTIIGNEVGIQASSSTITSKVTNNNIVDSTKNSIAVSSSGNVDATNNWWGTTNQQEISQSIWDNKNYFTLGTVNFQPILTQPSTSAPSSDLIEQTLDSVGVSSFNFVDYAFRADILSVAKYVTVAIVVGWILTLVIFVVRRFKSRYKQP